MILSNPSENSIQIKWPSGSHNGSIKILLISLAGKVLYESDEQANEIKSDHLSAGIYLLKIEKEGQVLASEKVLVQ